MSREEGARAARTPVPGGVGAGRPSPTRTGMCCGGPRGVLAWCAQGATRPGRDRGEVGAYASLTWAGPALRARARALGHPRYVDEPNVAHHRHGGLAPYGAMQRKGDCSVRFKARDWAGYLLSPKQTGPPPTPAVPGIPVRSSDGSRLLLASTPRPSPPGG